MEKIKLNLHEISIPEKEWKRFKNNASEDELLTLGIGIQYKLAKSRILSFICAIGLIAAFITAAVIIATGSILTDAFITFAIMYVVFAFLCTKKIRYETSLNQVTSKLSPEYKSCLRKLFVPSTVVSVIDIIVYMVIIILTLPYQLLMYVVGLIFPKFVISKNGVLVAVPRGYGLDQLEAIGEYYEGISLFDEYMESVHEQTHRYQVEITNDMGTKSVLHSSDNVHFYADEGTEYISDDGGQHVRKVEK